MKKREILWIVVIILLVVTFLLTNNQTPSKFDEQSFQKRIDSLSLIIENNNKIKDSLELDNKNRQIKIGELSTKLTKLNEKSKYYEKKYKEELDIINDMSDDDIIGVFSNTFK
jgi:hypothetical protein